MSETPVSAREGALAKLAAEAARFTAHVSAVPEAYREARVEQPPRRPAPRPTDPDAPPGYVPVAVAPERGNTRPVVPVDGRIHMRMAQPTVDALDEVVASWKRVDPVGLRDLERATLIRIAVALALTDIAQHGSQGAVGEAVRAALDPAVRHTDGPMPSLQRWFRGGGALGVAPGEGRPVAPEGSA